MLNPGEVARPGSANSSREAAKECSPRRKPWGSGAHVRKPRRGDRSSVLIKGALESRESNATRHSRIYETSSFAPSGFAPLFVMSPRLAPWAAFFRRFAATV